MADPARRIYALQFHPEVAHTEDGSLVLHNFLFRIAGLAPGWSMSSFVATQEAVLRETIGDRHVVCALSGGVDSTVVAVMLHRAIGRRLHCIFVDNGLLRLNEGEEVVSYLREHFDLNLIHVDAADHFLSLLSGVTDPEEKRKIIAGPSSRSSSARRKSSRTWPFWPRARCIRTSSSPCPSGGPRR
jgi:GMP synthase (glutamine-hydrolysing)